jgi:hypothetical protein
MHYTDCAGLIRLLLSALSAGVIYQKNPDRDITERNDVGARHHLPSSWNPVRDITERNDVGRGIIYRHRRIPLGIEAR